MIQELNEKNDPCVSSKLDTELATSSNTISPQKRNILETNPDVEKYKSFLLKPHETKRFKPSEALDKVRNFLPDFKASTSKLMDAFKENPDAVNIESVEEGDQHIEMNLAYVTESSDSDSDNDEAPDNSDSSDSSSDSVEKSIDPIGLGFEVKDLSQISLKLKTSKPKNKPFIKIIDDTVDEKTESTTSTTTKNDLDV